MEKNKYKILTIYLLIFIVGELALMVVGTIPRDINFGGLEVNEESFSGIFNDIPEGAFRLCSLKDATNPKCVIGVKAPLNSQSVNING